MVAKYSEIKIDTHIYEVCESTCHECSTKDEVKNDKKKSIVEKADLILKKDMEHKKITRKRNLKLVVHSMKESSEKAMEIYIELRLNVDEQQDDISDIDDSDEV